MLKRCVWIHELKSNNSMFVQNSTAYIIIWENGLRKFRYIVENTLTKNIAYKIKLHL